MMRKAFCDVCEHPAKLVGWQQYQWTPEGKAAWNKIHIQIRMRHRFSDAELCFGCYVEALERAAAQARSHMKAEIVGDV